MNQHRNKLRKASRLIAFLTIFTLLFGCMGCSKKTPREALDEAFEKTFVTDNPSETLLGLSEINSHLSDNKAYSTGLSVTLQELSGKNISEYAGILSGLGFQLNTASDLSNRRSAGTMDITYGGVTYLSLGGQLQGSKVYLTAPQLLDGSITVDFSTLQDDLASDSFVAQIIDLYGIEVPEDLFSELLESFASPSSLADLGKLVSSYNELNDAITVEKIDKKSVDFSSDVSYKTAYCVTIPEYAYASFIIDVLEYAADASLNFTDASERTVQEELDLLNTELAIQQLSETIGDIVLNVGVNKNGYICCAESSIGTGAESILFTATFTGKDHPLDDTDVVLSTTINGQTAELVYAQDFDSDANEASFDFSVKVNGSTELKLAGKGVYSDIVKGQKYTFDYDYIELEISDELFVSLSGNIYVDITKCDIPTPSSTEYNIFRMSEEDFSSLAEEVLTNLQEDPLLSKLTDFLDM